MSTEADRISRDLHRMSKIDLDLRDLVTSLADLHSLAAEKLGEAVAALNRAHSQLVADFDRIRCSCSPLKQEYCHANGCKGGSALGEFGIERAPGYVWVERTWRDAREGDVVRPPGAVQEIMVVGRPCILRWHLAPGADDRMVWRNHPEHVQRTTGKKGEYRYRPEDVYDWESLGVTLIDREGGEQSRPGGERGLDPAAAVEIRVTAAELAAIERLGGWQHRL